MRMFFELLPLQMHEAVYLEPFQEITGQRKGNAGHQASLPRLAGQLKLGWGHNQGKGSGLAPVEDRCRVSIILHHIFLAA